jgi:hypothetical protein
LKNTKPIPFDFVVERLHKLSPQVRPLFGCHAVYINEKIVLALRKKNNSEEDNGVWIATTSEHHSSLRKDFPSIRSIKIFGVENSGWQVLPQQADDFEESAMKLCDLIISMDVRIGKIPKKKKKKSA